MVNERQMLQRGCNLVQNGTHYIEKRSYKMGTNRHLVVRVNEGIVINKESRVGMRNSAYLRSMKEVKSNYDALDGCAKCKLYGQCLPTPHVMIYDKGEKQEYVAILLTALED